VDIAVNSQDRVYVGSRGNHPVLIFDRNGKFISCWGEGHFGDPHGVCIAPDDSVFITDRANNVVEKVAPGGQILMTLGTRGVFRPMMLRQPFNQPTDLAVSPSGELYVCDGYGNFLMHKFSAEGKLLKTWGEPGNGPGQFALPHRVGINKKGIVYVADRNADRIQLFTPDGEFITMWTDFRWPQDLYVDRKNELVYVVESPQKSRLSIRDFKGKIIWQLGAQHRGKTLLYNCHTVFADSRGDIYVGEIVKTKRIMKFVKV
jgi:DNA-binding beta-propeller fold protein YncE